MLGDEPNLIARMATVSQLLYRAFDEHSWTGFYLVDRDKPEELVIGPYNGPLGCLRIAFGRGVCGTAAATGETQVVPDVHAFPGHIACDATARSEIVVPVITSSGRLLGVLDIDSRSPETFDEHDARALEGMMGALFSAH